MYIMSSNRFTVGRASNSEVAFPLKLAFWGVGGTIFLLLCVGRAWLLEVTCHGRTSDLTGWAPVPPGRRGAGTGVEAVRTASGRPQQRAVWPRGGAAGTAVRGGLLGGWHVLAAWTRGLKASFVLMGRSQC